MFKAYFDRSELGSPADVVAVGGYLSSDEKWREFEPRWQRVLSEFGVETFHMTDFECRRGAFENWDQGRRTAMLAQLIDLIANHPFVAIGGAMVVADYNAISEEDRVQLGHPYAMCGLKAVADTLRWVDQRIDRAVATGEWEVIEIGRKLPVEFVFEEGDEGAGELAAQLRKEQHSEAFAGRIGRVSFEQKKVGALQAAELRGVRDDETRGSRPRRTQFMPAAHGRVGDAAVRAVRRYRRHAHTKSPMILATLPL